MKRNFSRTPFSPDVLGETTRARPTHLGRRSRPRPPPAPGRAILVFGRGRGTAAARGAKRWPCPRRSSEARGGAQGILKIAKGTLEFPGAWRVIEIARLVRELAPPPAAPRDAKGRE